MHRKRLMMHNIPLPHPRPLPPQRSGPSPAVFLPTMITGFAPRVSRDHLLRLTVLFLRVASLGAAVAYAVVGR